jgi:hypothetical protein
MAMTLADVRAKYPQYKDVEDKKLADAIYNKHYAGKDRREFDARIGLKPYQNALEATATAIGNLPGNIAESKYGIGQLAAETVSDIVDPRTQFGNTPPLKVTPGAPIEDLLTQPAGVTLPVRMNPTDPVTIASTAAQLLPEGVRRGIAEGAAMTSLGQQLRRAEAAEAQDPIDVAPGSLEEIAASAGASVVEMAAPALASVLVRNPAPLVAYFTARSAGTGYNTARDEGTGTDTARAAAGLYAAAEAVTEAIAGRVLIEGGKTLIGSILKTGVAEGLTEAATEALQALIDAQVIGMDMTLDDALQRIKVAGAAGAVAGGVIAPIARIARGATERPTQGIEVVEPAVVAEDVPIEDRIGLPGPETLRALPSPEQFRTPDLPRRQPDAPRREEPKPPTEDQIDYQAQIALQRTKQVETAELFQTARETITPLGTFDVDEIGQAAAGKVRQHRIQMGRPVEAPVTIEDMARAKVPQRQIDAVIAQRRPVTSETPLTALDVMRAADAKNIIPTDSNFAELALRTTGQRNVQRMTQAQLNALKTTIDAMPAHSAPVTVPLAEQSPFTDEQYGKALDAVREQGRYTDTAIKQATGLKNTSDVNAIRDAMVRRGQLVERGKGDYRLYDTLGVERQSVPDDLPPGAFKEYTARRVPVSKLRVTKDGKSVGTFSSATQARKKVSKIREKDRASAVAIEPAADTAWGVMENRYDEQGNLLGSVVVDSYRDEADAQKALDRLNAPPDTGARYTQTDVTPPPSAAPGAAPTQRPPMPPAFAGRLPDIVKRLNAQARDRKLPLLGVRVQLKPEITGPDGAPIEGFYLRKVISLATQYLSPGMSTDQIVESLARVMDHETVHALRVAGVLSPETDGWKTIVRYTRRAKRPDSTETYFDWAQRNYGRPGNPDGPLPGYETRDSIEEEAIAEAFRAWAANRRNVAGKPATVFRQIVEWFKRLLNAVPEDAFRAIETGTLVSEALTPRGSDMTRARETRKMEAAAAEISAAQQAKDENLVQVKSREYLRAREQARDDRFGRSGPKTVLGTTPTKAYSTGEVGDTALARSFADKYRQENGVGGGRLMTLLPVDTDYMIGIADAQQRGVHAPGDAAVAKAYRALINETKRMYQALGDLEVTAWTAAGAPYDSPASMLGDIASGKLTMRLSDDTFGPGADNPGHPLNAASGYKTTDGRVLTNNDIFRVVHDVYGHGQSGFRDDPRGAYNAYHEHARLLSPEARRALATETLAQRAWQEFGGHLRRRDGTVPRATDVDYLPPNQKEFAEQKAFLLDEEVVGSDPGWALAEKASDVEETPKFSRFDDNLPGGRLYGNPNRSPGGALSAPGTPTPAFTFDRPGNQFFGGELADEQLRMAREGDRGTTMIYMSPEDFLVMANAEPNPEQEVYDAAIEAGYKLSGLPSLVTSGYAGNVRAVAGDSTAGAAALVGRADAIPVLLYPKDGQSLGLVTALEAPDGSRLPWPHEGRAENFPEVRGPRYSVGSPEFRAWFGDSAVVNEDGSPRVVYHGTGRDFSSFDVGKAGSNIDSGFLGAGIYATDSPRTADYYANAGLNAAYSPNVLPLFAAIRNPFMWGPKTQGVRGLVFRGERLPETIHDAAVARAGYQYDPSAELSNTRAEEMRLSEAVREVLIEQGYDGVIAEYGASGEREYVAFEPTQVKSAIANRGTYDVADPDIRYSLNAPFGTRVPDTPPGPMFNIVQQKVDGWVGKAVMNIGRSKRSLPVVGSIFDLRVKLQDKMLSVKEMIEQIKEAGGNIDDMNDTYMLEQLYHGKVFDQIKTCEDDLQVPLLEALRAAHDGPNKVMPKDLEDYLYARHAPERNAYLRARGAADPNPSGMSDAEASSILDQLAIDGKMGDLEVLAAMADAIVADTTRTRVEAGLISEEAAASSPYEYYVPLRGFAEENLDPGNPSENQSRARSGKGFSVGGREDRTVTGRERKAGDLLGHLFLQNTEAVIRAQKNEVALSFMRLLQQNAELGFGQILKTAPTRRVVGGNGMIHDAGDPSYRQDPSIVTAKWKGKEIIARVADPRLARAIKSDYVSSSNDLVNALTNVGGTVNRYLATVNTSLNPEFLISNLARDMQTAGILGQQYGIKDFSRKIIGDAPKAMAGIREVLRTGEANSEMARAFREMQQAGGTTEFLGINDLETQVNRIRNSITQTGWKTTPRKAAEQIGKVFKFVDDYNKVAENAFRLSAYKAAKEAGASTAQAAFLAKNLTVNFNKGGELKEFMNAYYLFYNASIQGSAVLMNGLKNKRVQKIVAGVVVAGLLQDVINRALSGDEDENGVTDYDDIPDYVLETNFVLMDPLNILESVGIKSGYFAIPMPYGFNAFYNLGRNTSAAFSGSPVRNVGKSIVDSLLGFVDSFNPLGGVQSVWNFMAPTIADPVVDIITNKDYAGADIVPDRPTFGVPVPDSQKYWSNTSDIPVGVAEQLNRLTGGNEVRKGAIDISPEILQYGFDYATGAVGKFAQRLGKLAFETTPNTLRGDFSEIEIGDIPFARRLVGSIGSRGNTERYYTVAQEVATVAAELELFGESGRLDEAQRVVDQNPVEVSLIQLFKNTQKELQDLRRQRKVIEANDQIEAGQKREVIRQIKERQDAIMRRANTIYFEQKKAVR